MIKQKWFLGIVFIISLSALSCAGSHTASGFRLQDSGISLNRLLAELPADNQLEQQLLSQAIIGMGSDSVIKCICLLEDPTGMHNLQAEYAVDGMVQYAAARGNGSSAGKTMQICLVRGYSVLNTIERKRFLLDRLDWIAGDAQIPFLSGLLNQKDVSASAIRVLTTIGSKSAGKVLHKNLLSGEAVNREGVIQALGVLDYAPAADDILKIVSDEKDPGHTIALEALIAMGYKPVLPVIESIDLEKEKVDTYHIKLAQSLSKKGNTSAANALYERLLADEQSSEQIKIAALNGLMEKPDASSPDRLISYFSSPLPRVRNTAFRIAERMDGETETLKWVALLSNDDPGTLTGLIAMLGRRGDRSAVPGITAHSDHPEEVVRRAVLDAVFQLDHTAFLKLLGKYLRKPLSGSEMSNLNTHLSRVPSDKIAGFMMSHYPECSNDGKELLLQACAPRVLKTVIPLYMEALASEASNVRLAALDALEPVADDSVLPPILVFATRTESKKEAVKAARVISGMYNRADNKREFMAHLVNAWQGSNTSQKIHLLEIFRSIGGAAALRIIQDDVNTSDPEFREAVAHTLAEWPDDSVIDLLFENLNRTIKLKHRVLFARGIIRLMKDPAIPDIRAVYTLQKFRQYELRTEEKRLLISALGERATPDALREILFYLKDTDLNYEAFMAALSLAGDEETEPVSRQMLTMTILDEMADPALKEKIALAPVMERPSLNQPPYGFTALFNGEDLTNWKGLVDDPPKRALMTAEELEAAQIKADSIMRAHWHVVDGILFFDGGGQSLCTIRDYRNFELFMDWKIEKDGDSGVYLRGAPQVQIWDPSFNPVGSGGLFNNQKNPGAPLETADRPMGEWNTFRIIMKGERVTVFLNDVKVVDNIILENYWERDKPIYPNGQIELQAHFCPLYFRNIFIRELPDDDELFEGSLFNGMNLDGWQIVGNKPETWQVENGILFTTGEGGGWIATTKEFSNFKLNLEFRVPEGGNSGVFLRSPLTGDPAYTGMEIQVLDDYAEVYKTLKPWQYTGSLYGLQAPKLRATKPAGEWQSMEIVCDGPRIKVTVNGQIINDADLIMYMEQVDSHPGIKRRKGVIGLQNHSSRVEFRNINLQELPGE